MATDYDFLIAGGGAAGLSLAFALVNSPLRDRRILIVDPQPKDRNDRTWGFWTDAPTPFEPIIYHRWPQIEYIGGGRSLCIDQGRYSYQLLRGIDFYQFVGQALAEAGVERRIGSVERISETPDAAQLWVDGQPCSGRWAFDGRYRLADLGLTPQRFYNLKQHFKGWEIRTPAAAFDPQAARLFDFRTPQQGAMRFMYLLPFEPDRALVEYTLFSAALLPEAEYEHALRQYLGDVLGLASYEILHEEKGVIPMTDRPFQRRAGKRILRIGSAAGRVKPSSGYAFTRIQRDSQAIVASLLAHGHPFKIPASPWRYHQFDRVMLEIIESEGPKVGEYFGYLFGSNPIARVYRFLDERGSVFENLLIMASLPFWPYLRASGRAWLRRRR